MNQKLKLIQEHPEIKEAMWEFLNYKRFILVGRTEFEIKFQDFERSLEEKPLFITNGDNEEVFEEDMLTSVFIDLPNNQNCFISNVTASLAIYHQQEEPKGRVFKSEDKAKQFYIENARVLSIADLKKYMDDARNSFVPIYLSDKTEYGAESIVKQRLNLK